jgi:hypothetical protein
MAGAAPELLELHPVPLCHHIVNPRSMGHDTACSASAVPLQRPGECLTILRDQFRSCMGAEWLAGFWRH